MTSKPVPLPLAGFVRLGRSAYILQRSSANSTLSSLKLSIQEPGLILLCSWLDAAPKHIAKYTSGYQHLYPSSTIVLLTTALVDSTLALPSSRTRRIKPVLDILTALPHDTKVLLHSFSNGGASTACLLATAYDAETGKPLPISALVLDSSPGKGEHFLTHTAMAMGLPQSPRVFYFFLSFALHIFLLAYRVVMIVSLQEDLITESRRKLNVSKYIATGVPRLYVYSDVDLLIREKDVEAHADEAKKLDYVVQMEKWEGSRHCGHLVTDEARYWTVVKNLWNNKDKLEI